MHPIRPAVILLAAMAFTAARAAPAERTFRIGYQKYGTLVVQKARRSLEARLLPLGVRVTWTEFLGGPALLEAMGAGSIDFGTTGDAPPIFAQAAGVPLVYIAVEPATPHGEAIIVPQASPIHAIADLRGKKIALNRGSNVHNLLVRVLAAGHLTPADVQPVFLSPSDARPAFEGGSVDAWAIWDPYLAAAQTALKTRIICDGVGPDGRVIDENRQFFIATRDFATANPDVLAATLADLRETEAYAAAHRAEIVRMLAPTMGIDPAAVTRAVARLGLSAQPVDDRIMAGQQKIADTMADLHLIPARVSVADARPPHGF